MKSSKWLQWGFLGAVLLMGASLLSAQVTPYSKPKPLTADVLWGQKFADLAGKPLAMSAMRGKTLVVNFWATWCPPCRREMPGFSRLHESYRGKGVQFIGVAIDTPENVRDFALQYPVAYPLVMGGDTAVNLSRELGNSNMGLPFTVLIDASGTIRRQKLGGYAESALEADLQQILKP